MYWLYLGFRCAELHRPLRRKMDAGQGRRRNSKPYDLEHRRSSFRMTKEKPAYVQVLTSDWGRPSLLHRFFVFSIPRCLGLLWSDCQVTSRMELPAPESSAFTSESSHRDFSFANVCIQTTLVDFDVVIGGYVRPSTPVRVSRHFCPTSSCGRAEAANYWGAVT